LGDRILKLDVIAEQSEMLIGLLAGVEVIRGKVRNRSTSGGPSGTKRKKRDSRQAPGALGLIAKNVRNIAVLQPAHRPTAEQKQLALALAVEAGCLAAAARDSARRAFGRADYACRVAPRTKPVRRIITHSEPDGDAIAAASLAERFLFVNQPVEVLFVPRERALSAYRAGDCLVDVGNTHDPMSLFFDHKPPALPSRHYSCAAKLVWKHLGKQGCAVGHLEPFVNVAWAGDSPRARSRYLEECRHSQCRGFHAAIARARQSEETDAKVYRQVRRWLDRAFLG
jgi:hypothetical protein